MGSYEPGSTESGDFLDHINDCQFIKKEPFSYMFGNPYISCVFQCSYASLLFLETRV
jgi:hypothetical protein